MFEFRGFDGTFNLTCPNGILIDWDNGTNVTTDEVYCDHREDTNCRCEGIRYYFQANQWEVMVSMKKYSLPLL